MADRNIVEINTVVLDLLQVSALNRLIVTETPLGASGAFDVHMNGTIFPFSSMDVRGLLAVWDRLFTAWSNAVANVRQFRVGVEVGPTETIAIDLDRISLVGPVQILPVVELHVHQRAIVPVHLNGSILNADYSQEVHADAGRAEIIKAWEEAEAAVAGAA